MRVPHVGAMGPRLYLVIALTIPGLGIGGMPVPLPLASIQEELQDEAPDDEADYEWAETLADRPARNRSRDRVDAMHLGLPDEPWGGAPAVRLRPRFITMPSRAIPSSLPTLLCRLTC